MPDIIDNRTTKLTDRICQYLRQSRAAHFAVGYFYVGGFEAIAAAVPGLERLRLLIGPATSRRTAEDIARGCRARRLVEQEWLREVTPRSAERSGMRQQTSDDVRKTMCLLEQTDGNEQVLRDLAGLIADGTVEVRVYTREPLHAKCYIFDEQDSERAKTDPGWVIVGSSNLTVSGITSNTEMNVVLHDPEAHREVSAWFERLWQDADDFSPELLREVASSWAVNEEVTPWDIYIKTLYNLFRDQLEAEAERVEVIDERWPELANFQERAYNWAKAILQEYGGVLVADVVGLGKSYIGLALLKWGRLHGRRPLIICPAGLTDMWETYSDMFDVGAPVVSMGALTVAADDEGNLCSILDEDRYEDRNLVLIDESHNFRYTNTQRYEALETYLSRGDREVVMLTATPMAIGPDDIRNQLRLWPGNGQNLPTGQLDFEEFFRQVKRKEAYLPDMLRHVMIRRPRSYIAENYGQWRRPDGTPCQEHKAGEHGDGCRPVILIGNEEYTFPKRELKEPATYRIDEAYQGLYATIRTIIDPSYHDEEPLRIEAILERVEAGRQCAGDPPMTSAERQALARCLSQRLTYARYGLHDYVREGSRDEEPYRTLAAAGRNLRGLMRTLLFKRLESSVEAFRTTCRTLAQVHRRFITAMDEDRIPAGQEMQRAIYDLGVEDVAPAEVMDAIETAERKAATRYDVRAFQAQELREDLNADQVLFEALYHMVCNIQPDDDAKLQRLRHLTYDELPSGEKLIIFTQFEDTARYLHEQFAEDPEVEWASGARGDLASIIGRFAPRANPALHRRYAQRDAIRILISTDVLSEGLNLQDAHYVVNYDLHFNPVRLIQRMGRIDRLTPYFPADAERSPERVWAWNFFPETELDAHLDLEQKVRRRVQEMRRVVGVDGAVLHPTEELDEAGVISIYTGDSRAAEGEEEEDLRSSLLEAESLIRKLQEERPEELARIRDLPDGVRSARTATKEPGYYTYCQAGTFHQLYLADEEGEIISTDLREALGAIACEEDEPRTELPRAINHVICRIKAHFDEAVKELQARQETKPRHSLGQKYVLSHLREARMMASDEEAHGTIDLLISAFQQALPTAVRRRLNYLRREKVEGDALLQALSRVYNDHQLFRPTERAAAAEGDRLTPRIICSESC